MGFLLLLLLLLSHVITLWCYNVMVLVHSQCAPLKDFLKILWPDQFSNVPHFFYFFKLCRVPNSSKQNVTKIFVFYFICWRRIIIFCWPLCQGAPLDSPSKTSNFSENKTKWLRNDLSLLTFPRHIFGKFNPNPWRWFYICFKCRELSWPSDRLSFEQQESHAKKRDRMILMFFSSSIVFKTVTNAMCFSNDCRW